jgi:hypothetical protein
MTPSSVEVVYTPNWSKNGQKMYAMASSGGGLSMGSWRTPMELERH